MIGKTISHYKILEELGRGGMGVVYKAMDTRLERTVALKFLSPGVIGSVEERARFAHEAKAAAALNHPNICTIYEIDEVDGQHFIAMELIEGASLKERVAEGPLPLGEAIDITRQIAAGLEKAHEQGIVHRDIKAANIMITDGGQVKIMDFGLAKARGATQLTREGTTLGTVRYMSPEQARGAPVDHRSDIWSLGVVLFEMVTGRFPFTGEYDQAVIYSIINAEPETLTAIRTGVPVELERIVNRCLEKDPAERYQTARDLDAALHKLQRLETSGAWSERVEKAKARRKGPSGFQGSMNRWLWLLLLCVPAIAYLIVFVIVPRYFSGEVGRNGPERTRLVVLPFENLGPPEDEYFADGITEEITSRLASIHALGVISRKSALHYKDSDKTISEIGADLDVDYVLEGTVRWERNPNGGSRVRVTPQLIRVSDDSHIWAERYDEDFEAIFDVQTRIAEQVTAQLGIALTGGEQDVLQSRPTENTVAYQIYLRAADRLVFSHRPEINYREAQKLLEQVVEIDPYFALAHAKLSHVHRSIYFYGYERTEEQLRMAKEEMDRALELDHDAPEVQRELGYYYYQGLLDYDKALGVFTALAARLPNDAQLLQDIAYIWRRQGHFEQALANLETAYSMNPMDPGLCAEIAHTDMALRRPEEALEYSNKTIAMAPEGHWGYFLKGAIFIFGSGDVRSALEAWRECPDKSAMSMIWARYYIYLLDRDYQGILDMFEDSTLDVIRIQGAYLPVSMLKGHAYALMGEEARARSYYKAALEHLEKAVRENPNDPRIYSAMGYTYAGLGRKEEAIAFGEKSVEIYPVTKDALLGADRLMDLIRIYARVGENEAAIELIRRILTIPAIYTIYAFELDPCFDSLREDPAYKQLVREFGKE